MRNVQARYVKNVNRTYVNGSLSKGSDVSKLVTIRIKYLVPEVRSCFGTQKTTQYFGNGMFLSYWNRCPLAFPGEDKTIQFLKSCFLLGIQDDEASPQEVCSNP